MNWLSGSATLVAARRISTAAKLNLEQLESRDAPALLGQQLFPDDNPWNQRITAAPVAANSSAIMNNIIAQYGNGRIQPDFGQDYNNSNDLYGIPFNVVRGDSVPSVEVVIDAYAGESDIAPAPIIPGVVLEGDYQNGPRSGLNNRGDSHLLVFDVDNNVAYEFFRASRPSENADGKWHADQQTIWDMNTNTFRTLGWTSADAAGLSILAGLVRPDEALPVAQGGQGVIDHAIRFTLRNNIILDKYAFPASHTANPGNNNEAIQPPMGTRFRLKAGVDISQLNPQSKIVAQAMKDYGLILADNGSNFFFTGSSFSVDANNQFTMTWNDNDIQDFTRGLKSLRYDDFEVVDLRPAVLDLDLNSGSAGTSVTITGRNFSGAAGNLKVLFGSTPASSFTLIDDSRIVATAPAGSGTVDVRVQSGVDAPGNPKNINNPIFGYGISAISENDRFTYGSSEQWQFTGGNWTQNGGMLSQISTAAQDPRKAIFVGESFPANVEIVSRVRVNSWTNGEYARAGVGLYTSTADGKGYNLVFRGNTGSAGRVQFLDDGVKWGNSYAFSWDVGTWYVFKLKRDQGVLYGKVWADGTAEPANWQFTQTGWTNRTSGAPSLNGGSASGSGAGNSTVSFDAVVPRGLSAGPVDLSATASAGQIDLSWTALSGASGYRILRSLDGIGNWTQVGTATGTVFQDTGLAASTTYYYRVTGTLTAGDSAFSAMVSATTPGGGVLFSDNFNDADLDPAWQLRGGTWSQGNGVFRQTSTSAADPRKAMIGGQTFPANVEIVSRVRIESWTNGDYARAGIGLYTDMTTGKGYNLVFRGNTGSGGRVQFLDDGVRWGNSYSFAWDVGVWYVFKLKINQGVLSGKVWRDGTPEPANWQFTQTGWTNRTGGAPSLNGGSASSSGAGNSTVSFDDVVVSAV